MHVCMLSAEAVLIRPGKKPVGYVCSNQPLRRPLSGGARVSELQTISDSLTVVFLFSSLSSLLNSLAALYL